MNIVLKLLSSFCIVAIFCCASLAQDDTSSKDTSVNIHVKLSDFVSDDEEEKAKADSVLELLNDIDNLLKFTENWKIKKGDDTLWAAVNYDDKDWIVLDDDSVRDNTDYGSITWYRRHFTIDSNLIHVPLAFYVQQFGSACDVYIDGKFLKSFGTVGKDKQSEVAEFSMNPPPFAFVFTGGTKHVFAVRYSNFHRTGVKSSGFNIGKNFRISVKHLNQEIQDAANPSKYFPIIFFAAIFITLAAVHFIMFIYQHQKVANLYYSLYCLGIFCIAIYIYYLLTSTNYAVITLMSETAGYLAPLLIVPLVAMLHIIFYNRLLKIFWILIVFYASSAICLLTGYKKASMIIVVFLFLIASVEVIRVIVKSIKKRKDGAWIFSLAILLPFITGTAAGFLPDELKFEDIKLTVNVGGIVGASFILGLPLAMTIYLARDFARMSKKLNTQLKEITELSAKSLVQEKEKKQILENQKTELEKKVSERTQEVLLQKEVIEVKNKEITESLVYAKRIQSAILPDIKLIYKTLDQSFILYLPKDIVSGDFYGFAQKNGKVIIAAADCTGHGVAGAFMSMIGSALLNQIINEKGITTPSKILDELNDGIIQSLKQKESDSNDGMDISVCAFDLGNNVLEFAGANRPLWLIRNGLIDVYKPDKFPIGGLQVERKQKFSEHKILLQKNDSVYLFSDGFADQFGGERGKKLMTKKFKDTLLAIQNLSMREQENYLKQLFETWKGNNEQVDDVLVIGIRV